MYRVYVRYPRLLIRVTRNLPKSMIKDYSHGPLARYINCGLRMRRECRERFPRHRLRRKTLVSDPDMHHGTCVTHVPWCMSASLNCDGGENVPGIPDACATRNFAYLVRGPLIVNVSTCLETDRKISYLLVNYDNYWLTSERTDNEIVFLKLEQEASQRHD